MHAQIQYFEGKVVKDQNLLNMQKITHWSATNAILLIRGLYNYSVVNQ